MSANPSEWLELNLSRGRYRITSRLGEGGMGFVYKANDGNLDTPVVIKVPRRAMLDDPQFVERFQREIRSLVTLSHPHIVKIIDVGQHEGIPFAVMQYLDGGDLEGRRNRAADGRPMAESASALYGWLPEVASALDFVHRKGYVHRDVKPGNVLFDAEGHAYLGDFGVAKVVRDAESGVGAGHLTSTGTFVGTPEYTAPELAMGEEITGRVDQYALAVTVYELVAGHPPFRGQSSSATLVEQVTKPVPALDTVQLSDPAALSSAVLRALSKKPGDRYATCAEFADAVLSASRVSKDRPPTSVERPVLKDRPPTRVEQPIVRSGQATMVEAPSVLPVTPPRKPTIAQPSPVGTEASQSKTETEIPQTQQQEPEQRATGDVPLRLSLLALLVFSLAIYDVFFGNSSFLNPPDVEPRLTPAPQASAKAEAAAEKAAAEKAAAERAAVEKAAVAAAKKSMSPAQLALGAPIVDSIGMLLVPIPSGTFTMGDGSDAHQVTLTKPFYLGFYEVTQEQYEKVMGTNPSEFRGAARPVELVLWDDAVEFCKKLSAKEGKRYRLPTEAEWEYACRAGSTTRWSFGDDPASLREYAWYRIDPHSSPFSHSNWRTYPVGQKKPNAWGLYDMHGNVYEWCQDWYGDYSSDAVTDPSGPQKGDRRVLRGGSFSSVGGFSESVARTGSPPGNRNRDRGFRVARTYP